MYEVVLADVDVLARVFFGPMIGNFACAGVVHHKSDWFVVRVCVHVVEQPSDPE